MNKGPSLHYNWRMGSLASRLKAGGVYQDLVSWAETFGDDEARAIEECPRGDWLLAIAVTLERPRTAIVRAACDCAELAIDPIEPAHIEPAITGIAAARAWAIDSRGIDPGIEAACEALAEHPDPSIQTAALAALAALQSIRDPRQAPAAAASAASIAALSATDCGMAAAVRYAQRRSAELAREAAFGDWRVSAAPE